MRHIVVFYFLFEEGMLQKWQSVYFDSLRWICWIHWNSMASLEDLFESITFLYWIDKFKYFESKRLLFVQIHLHFSFVVVWNSGGCGFDFSKNVNIEPKKVFQNSAISLSTSTEKSCNFPELSNDSFVAAHPKLAQSDNNDNTSKIATDFIASNLLLSNNPNGNFCLHKLHLYSRQKWLCIERFYQLLLYKVLRSPFWIYVGARLRWTSPSIFHRFFVYFKNRRNFMTNSLSLMNCIVIHWVFRENQFSIPLDTIIGWINFFCANQWAVQIREKL